MRFIDCFPNHCFCEQVSSQTIIQPINTFSSLIFVLVGILIIALAIVDFFRKNKTVSPLEKKPLYGIFYGFVVIMSGLGTIFYHVKLTFFGQFLDFLGINFIVTFILLYGIIIRRRRSQKLFIFLYLLINSIFAYFLLWLPYLRRYIVVILVALVIISEYMFHRRQNVLKKISANRMDKRFLYFAVVILLFGLFVWASDTNKMLCNPSSFFQGHALWHILSAIAALIIYLYFRSEKSLLDILKCKISKKYSL